MGPGWHRPSGPSWRAEWPERTPPATESGRSALVAGVDRGDADPAEERDGQAAAGQCDRRL